MSDKKRSIYRKEYFAKRKMRIAVVVALLAVLAVLEIYSLSVNNFKVTFVEAWDAVINRIRGIPPVGYIENMIDYVVIEVDAPRAIGAIMVGTILAVCGAVMQTITRNALAEPYTIGWQRRSHPESRSRMSRTPPLSQLTERHPSPLRMCWIKLFYCRQRGTNPSLAIIPERSWT